MNRTQDFSDLSRQIDNDGSLTAEEIAIEERRSAAIRKVQEYAARLQAAQDKKDTENALSTPMPWGGAFENRTKTPSKPIFDRNIRTPEDAEYFNETTSKRIKAKGNTRVDRNKQYRSFNNKKSNPNVKKILALTAAGLISIGIIASVVNARLTKIYGDGSERPAVSSITREEELLNKIEDIDIRMSADPENADKYGEARLELIKELESLGYDFEYGNQR